MEVKPRLLHSASGRVYWTHDMHSLFLQAVSKLGCKASPATIKEEMNIEGLSRRQVGSHWQKFKKEVMKDAPSHLSHLTDPLESFLPEPSHYFDGCIEMEQMMDVMPCSPSSDLSSSDDNSSFFPQQNFMGCAENDNTNFYNFFNQLESANNMHWNSYESTMEQEVCGTLPQSGASTFCSLNSPMMSYSYTQSDEQFFYV